MGMDSLAGESWLPDFSIAVSFWGKSGTGVRDRSYPGGPGAVWARSLRTEEKKCRVQDLMRDYYGKLFPHQQMYKWLVYGNDSKHPQADGTFFNRRELCFTLDGDIFVRYQAFKDATDMAAAIIAKCPAKIDIGPVYTSNPQERLKFGAAFQPVERELVFDIDLTDYDDIIDRGLREDFGFQNILWVYSGRRGIHCWVCDPSARKLTDEQRASVVNYFAVYKGHENEKARIVMGSATMHPSVEKAAKLLEPYWRKRILPEQQLLEDEGMRETMLRYLPSEELQDEVRTRWDELSSASSKQEINLARWNVLVGCVEREKASAKSKGGLVPFKLQKVVNEIIFAFSYPRLDMEVSKKMNHLLKAPFCVHPKTGKVCVPLDPDFAFDFDPETVPTVQSLLKELKDQATENDENGEEWRKTQLASSVELFESAFLEGCMAASRAELASKARVAVAAGGKTDMSF
eukprot:gene15169-21241_t